MVKYHFLTWVGIVGGAITLFANFKGVLNLAHWAERFVEHWQNWNYAIWTWALGSIDIEPPRQIVPIFSFAVFITALVIGLNFSSRTAKRSQPDNQATRLRRAIAFLIGSILYTGLTVGFALTHDWLLTVERYLSQHLRDYDYLAVFLFPTAFLLVAKKERLSVALASLLFFLCAACLFVIPTFVQFGINTTELDEYDVLRDAVLLMILLYFYQIGWIGVVLFTPIRPLIQSLTFLLIGVVMLIGLGKIPKLDVLRY